MAEILTLEEIKGRLDVSRLLLDIEIGFVAYSKGETVVPPVGYLPLDPPNAGDVHIKVGYIRGAEHYVVKIASGIGGVSNGLMLLFCQANGELAAILLDQGYLTDVRTAVAGAIAAKYVAPKHVKRIGIVGTGAQARFQLRLLSLVTPCKDVMVWGRTPARVAAIQEDMTNEGFAIETARDIRELAASCNLIVTTTSAHAPVLLAADIQPGTHITAMGADAPGKQELDPDLVARADIVVADSREQCVDHGEIGHAVRAGLLNPARVLEMGEVITDRMRGRANDDQITIADLTDVAVQDIQIAAHVYRRLR